MRQKFYVSGLVLFCVSLIITAITLVAFNHNFYKKMYHKLDTATTMRMSEKDLNAATDTLLDYIQGKRNDIDLTVTVNGKATPMFNQREIDHMVDVRALFQNVITFRNISIIYVAILILVSLGLNDFADIYQNYLNLRNSLIILFTTIGAVIVYAIADFSSFWITFHKLLFSNDLWLLDPRTDRMIQMFPEPFFNAMVMRVVAVSGIIMVVLLIALYVLKRSTQRDTHRII